MTEAHPHAEAARDARMERAAAIGIDRPLIGRLVETFYDSVRQDAMLGPIFDARITDWEPHLLQMKRFWSSVLLGDGAYNGRPMPKHIAIPKIEAGEFRQWLTLFRATVAKVVPDVEAQELIIGRAEAIADSLLMGIRIHRDGREDIAAFKSLNEST